MKTDIFARAFRIFMRFIQAVILRIGRRSPAIQPVVPKAAEPEKKAQKLKPSIGQVELFRIEKTPPEKVLISSKPRKLSWQEKKALTDAKEFGERMTAKMQGTNFNLLEERGLYPPPAAKPKRRFHYPIHLRQDVPDGLTHFAETTNGRVIYSTGPIEADSP